LPFPRQLRQVLAELLETRRRRSDARRRPSPGGVRAGIDRPIVPARLAGGPGLLAERDPELLSETAGIERRNGDVPRLLPDPREIEASLVEDRGEDRAGILQDRDQQMAGVNDLSLVPGQDGRAIEGLPCPLGAVNRRAVMVMAPPAEPFAHRAVHLDTVELEAVEQFDDGLALAPQRRLRLGGERGLFPIDGLVQVPDPARANEAVFRLDVGVPAVEGLSHGEQLM